MDQYPSKAIRFEFFDNNSAVLAWGTLKELGYSPVREDGHRVHIHLERGDLTSALEIAMAHGGRLIEEAPMEEACYTDTAYTMDSIRIPAHIVNEDRFDNYTESDPEQNRL
ncbi:hypothetical protein [Paenibacillus abyssi]|uniref:Uncharacterized protein n=1 Tax=Paenibacillus abyssi TaxID=1340531 RepID=A0A917G0Z6_9BACL|nr:hypothetical protein [Paenibacillus abyssi]GGG17511.1 hypothetical protein GCM10010916_37940 [Paenibacillus abyssi]